MTWKHPRDYVISNVLMDIGKYTGLLLGVSEVVSQSPRLGAIIAAGAMYTMSSVLGKLANKAAPIQRGDLYNSLEKLVDETTTPSSKEPSKKL